MRPPPSSSLVGAGVLYLVYIGLCIAGLVIGREGILIDAAPGATLDAIRARPLAFRLGVAIDLITVAVFALIAGLLAQGLRDQEPDRARWLFALNLVGGAVYSLGPVALAALAGLAEGDAAPEARVVAAEALMHLRFSALLGAQLFYGAWVWPLARALFRTRLVPRPVAILVGVDTVALWGWFLQAYLTSGYQMDQSPPLTLTSLVAEVVLALALIARPKRRPGDPEP